MKYLKFVLLTVILLAVIGGGSSYAGTEVDNRTYVTTLTTQEVTDSSWVIDTIGIKSLLFPDGYIHSMKARFIVEPSPVVLRGLGLLDTCTLTLMSTFAGQWNTLGTSNRGALPCTLYVVLPSDTTAGMSAHVDSLLQEDLLLIFSIGDSTSDSTFTAPYNIKINYLLKY